MDEKLVRELSKPFHPSAIEWKPGAMGKGGKSCMALPYADMRAYQNRLDEVCPTLWSVTYTTWGNKIICHLTIDGVTRSSTGESTEQDDRNGMAGSVAESMAFKRAAAMFGLGRFLYTLPQVWAEFDREKKRITDAGQKELDARYKAWYQRIVQTSPQDATDAPHGEIDGNPATDTTEPPQPSVEAPDNPFADKAESADYVEIAPGEWANRLSEKQKNQLHALGTELYADNWEKVRHRNVRKVTNGRTESSNELSSGEADKLIAGMLKLKSKRAEKVAA